MRQNYIIQLKQILAKDSIPQKELAKRLGVTFATLNRWLNGHAIPHKRRIEQISRMHREIIGYAKFTKEDIHRIVKEANAFQNKKIWQSITTRQNLQDDLILEHTIRPHSSLGYRPPTPEAIQPRWNNLTKFSHNYWYN